MNRQDAKDAKKVQEVEMIVLSCPSWRPWRLGGFKVCSMGRGVRWRLTRLEITARAPYQGGMTFGEVGAYERIDGVIHFAVDPLHPANAAIVDLDKAARDAAGRVTFSADFCLLQPVDPARANRRLIFDVLNRGNRRAVPRFNHVPPALAQTTGHRPRRWLPLPPGVERRLLRLAVGCPAQRGAARPRCAGGARQ